MGFNPAALRFLRGLAKNNNKEWFEAHRDEYENEVREPMRDLIGEMNERFKTFAPEIGGDPKRSMFRINRDIRFSKDKSPYKTHVSASFPSLDGHAEAGAYFHLSPGEIYAGGGMWHPDRARLAAWRTIVDRGVGLEALDDPAFVATFGSVGGDALSRVPQGFPKDHPRADLLKLKDVTFGRRLSDDEAFSADPPDTLAATFASAIPVFRLLGGLTD